MGVYLYCIAAPDHPEPEGVKGINGARVMSHVAEGFALWVSELTAAPAASLDGIRDHNAVVERACEAETVVPVRFGQWFEDHGRLDEELRRRRAELEGALRRVQGAVEMGVRVTDTATGGDPPDRSSGRAYLEALANREQRNRQARERALALAETLRQWVNGRIRDQRARPLDPAVGILSVAHLVDRHDIGSYHERVRAFPSTRPDLRFQFSGPWPPYGFVDDGQTEFG